MINILNIPVYIWKKLGRPCGGGSGVRKSRETNDQVLDNGRWPLASGGGAETHEESRRSGLRHSWNSWGCVGWGDVRQGDNEGCGGGGCDSISCAGVVHERSKHAGNQEWPA